MIPDWNHLVYEGDWRERARQPPFDQQLPRVHRPRLPRAVRGELHAQHHRPAGDDQVDRMRDRRPRLEGRLDRAAGARGARPARRVAVVGSGPAGLACAQQLARAGHAVTVFEKADRVGGLLRYGIPDFKMEKHLINRRAVQMEAEGRHLQHLDRGRRRRVDRSRCSENFDAVVLAGGAEDAAPAADPRRRAARRAAGDGVPDPAEQAQRRRRRGARRAARHAHRDRQARDRDRRRRHRLGLRRHLEPPGRDERHPDRDHAQAAREGRQGADLAQLADEAAHLVEPRGRRRARLGGADQGSGRRERRGHRPQVRPHRVGRRPDAGDRRAASSCSRPT